VGILALPLSGLAPAAYAARSENGGRVMRTLVLGLVAFFSLVTSVLADPLGTYKISGTNPGDNSRYSGTVVVTRNGDTYRVVWTIGGQQYIGTGIGNKDFLAVSYASGNQTGLALYGASGNTWRGIWAYANGRQLGSEVWEP
jgi:hypothetical protein